MQSFQLHVLEGRDLVKLIIFTILPRTFLNEARIFFYCNYEVTKNTMTTSTIGATPLIRARAPAGLPIIAFAPAVQVSPQ